MDKIICAMCFGTLASILRTPLLVVESNSASYPTVWMAGTTLTLAIASLVVTRISTRRHG